MFLSCDQERFRHNSSRIFYLSPLQALLVGDPGLDPPPPHSPPPPSRCVGDLPGPFTAPLGEADLGDEGRELSGDAPLPPAVTYVMGADPMDRVGGDEAPPPSPACSLSR